MASGLDLARVIRVGTVSAVDNSKHQARVIFRDTNTVSWWLRVVDNRPCIPDYDVPQRTDYETEEDALPSHRHDLTISQWMPHVNDTVLVLYLPQDDADGFVIGGLDS